MRQGGVFSSRSIHTLSVSLNCTFFLPYEPSDNHFFPPHSCFDANGHALKSDFVSELGHLTVDTHKSLQPVLLLYL